MNGHAIGIECAPPTPSEPTTVLRIGLDGSIGGLWTDEIDWHALGAVHVERASYVEFDGRRQCWCVREARPSALWRRVLQVLLRRPMGRVLHTATRRAAALAWERANVPIDGVAAAGALRRTGTKYFNSVSMLRY